MDLSSAAGIPIDGLLACEVGRDVSANAEGSWHERANGVGVM
jgi:hypothetical protein